MTRYRVFGLSFLLLACLVAAPLALADKDKDKDKDKESKKAAPAKTSSTHHDPQHESGSQDSGHHGSSSQSSSSSSSSSNSSGSHEHSGESHHHGDVTGQSHTSGDSHDGSETHQSHQAESSQHTHGSHDTSRDTHVRIDSHHTTVVVDRDRLHERLAVHPGASERQHAYEHSRAERVLFERHIGAIHFVPANRVVLTGIRIVPTTYYYRRTVFYDAYGWSTPRYVYHLYPRYGLWDATFLAFALDHIAEEQYALMFYHHRHDAEIEQWMDDNDRLAADNENLRAELDEMRAKMDTFEQSGVTADPAYVPVDAQDVALSPEVITQLTSKK